MSRQDIARSLARNSNVPFPVADRLLADIAELITDNLSRGVRVNWRNFGSWQPVDRQQLERHALWATGDEKIVVPTHRSVRFTASAYLRRTIGLTDIGPTTL